MNRLSLFSLLLLTSCSTIASYLEKELECDESVNVELKCKIDFEDDDEKKSD